MGKIEEFKIVMLGLGEYYDKTITPTIGNVYWEGLKSFSIEEIKKAITRHIKSPDQGTFFPKISDLVKFISGSSADASQQAWAKVDHAVRHVGVYQSVAFDDAIIHRVIADMGGWPPFGQKTEDEWPFVANEFRQRYHALKARGMDGVLYPPTLPGNAELNNGGKFEAAWYRERGLPAPSPVAIGDKEIVLLIMAGGSNAPMVQIEQIGDITAGLVLPEPEDSEI